MRKLECFNCQKEFEVSYTKWVTRRSQFKTCGTKYYCNESCRNEACCRIKPLEVSCKQCSKLFLKKNSEIKRSKNNFCSRSCAAKYNNTHKKKGIRRSKLEIYIETELIKLFPNLEIHFNRKDAIDSELDIYIPSIKLAIELNGIFHYEPIYGEDKLNKIKNNDNRKFQACLENDIEFCTINTSDQSKFTKKSSKKYLEIICNLINSKIE